LSDCPFKSYDFSLDRLLGVKIFLTIAPDSRRIYYPVCGLSFLFISGMPTPDFSCIRAAPLRKKLTNVGRGKEERQFFAFGLHPHMRGR
jgi:hypothetical protein